MRRKVSEESSKAMPRNNALPIARLPACGLGLGSVILAAVGLLLFIFPVLSLPISGAGAVVGLAGIVAALAGGRPSLRLSVAGVLLSIFGLCLVTAIATAPTGYFQPKPVYSSILPLTGERTFVPPPAPTPGSKFTWRLRGSAADSSTITQELQTPPAH